MSEPEPRYWVVWHELTYNNQCEMSRRPYRTLEKAQECQKIVDPYESGSVIIHGVVVADGVLRDGYLRGLPDAEP